MPYPDLNNCYHFEDWCLEYQSPGGRAHDNGAIFIHIYHVCYEGGHPSVCVSYTRASGRDERRCKACHRPLSRRVYEHLRAALKLLNMSSETA